MERTFGIIGGDARFTELARLLREDGHPVTVWGIPDPSNTDGQRVKPESPPETGALPETAVPTETRKTPETEKPSGELPDALSEYALETALSADVLLLPLPLCKTPGLLNCPAHPTPLHALFRRIRPESRVLAGQVPEAARTLAREYGVRLEDYYQRESLLTANAAATADAAAALLVTETGESLTGKRCLVLGFGRIGKLLCRRLRALNASVTAAARREASRAWIRACGYDALDIRALAGQLGSFEIICNTVPAPMLDASLLSTLSPRCVLAELASRPGVEPDAAAELGLRLLPLRGLPGRVVPRTAARALRDTVYDMLTETPDTT